MVHDSMKKHYLEFIRLTWCIMMSEFSMASNSSVCRDSLSVSESLPLHSDTNALAVKKIEKNGWNYTQQNQAF